jgi:ribosomal protein S27AE
LEHPLKACPACGKQAGVLLEEKTSRFPFRVMCGECGTAPTKLEAVAVKLWNEAKREGKARARPK